MSSTAPQHHHHHHHYTHHYLQSTNMSGALPATAECTFNAWSQQAHKADGVRIFATIAALSVMVIVVVFGNALVIAAVLTRRRLRSATGILILSLAVADLMVGLVILPFSIAYEVLQEFWIFGDYLCTAWLTLDIWMCTASIYNLVAISVDRYIAIIRPLNYPTIVTKSRARYMVAAVWVLSFVICLPSFSVASANKPEKGNCKCTPAYADPAYIIFSASSSFYVPMVVVIFVYLRIFAAAHRATNSIYSGMMQVPSRPTDKANSNPRRYLIAQAANVPNGEQLPMLRIHRGSATPSAIKMRPSFNGGASSWLDPAAHSPSRRPSDANSTSTRCGGGGGGGGGTSSPKRCQHSPSFESNGMLNGKPDAADDDESGQRQAIKRLRKAITRILRKGPRLLQLNAYERRLSLEIKAAKTVAIVTGCFIFCWLGFAVCYGFGLNVNPVTWSILFWLGYLNSALNPVIYTVFNREFRACFKSLLTCRLLPSFRSSSRNRRRTESTNRGCQ